jgi:hypothetical protein
MKGLQNQFGQNLSFLNQLNTRLSIMPGMGQGGNPQPVNPLPKRTATKNPPLKEPPQN